MINETYSAFLQGFMPALARPDVDVLEGLTTSIIVDQERIGAHPRSTLGTVTDVNAMLRIIFSRLAKPHLGSPQAYSFNVPSVRASGAITVEKGAGKSQSVKTSYQRTGGMCSRCEGRGSVTDFDMTALYDDTLSLSAGALLIPGYSMDGWYGRIFSGSGYFDMDAPIRGFSKKQLHDLLYKAPTKLKVDGINVTFEGVIPKMKKINAVKRRRDTATACASLCRAGNRFHQLPRVSGHPSCHSHSELEDRRCQHWRCVRNAGERGCRVGASAR
jgi:excinuclease UvrABC ATPase subunit